MWLLMLIQCTYHKCAICMDGKWQIDMDDPMDEWMTHLLLHYMCVQTWQIG